MKISKLFHWLYAILMLMPIFAIGVSCLYVIFNKNAKDSYSGVTTYDITYKYKSNEVNSSDDLIEGNIYKLNSTMYANYFNVNFGLDFKIINGEITFNSTEFDDLYVNEDFLINDSVIIKLSNSNNDKMYVEVLTDNLTAYDFYCSSISYNVDNTIILIDYLYDTNYINTFSFLEYTDYNEIESINIDNSGTLDNVFYYSVEQLKNNSLFNWSRNSFLAQPITYISDLFGMDNDNIVIYLLSYWLDISIIWLVFDMVMYVPLVIHRWIDKGVLE